MDRQLYPFAAAQFFSRRFIEKDSRLICFLVFLWSLIDYKSLWPYSLLIHWPVSKLDYIIVSACIQYLYPLNYTEEEKYGYKW